MYKEMEIIKNTFGIEINSNITKKFKYIDINFIPNFGIRCNLKLNPKDKLLSYIELYINFIIWDINIWYNFKNK